MAGCRRTQLDGGGRKWSVQVHRLTGSRSSWSSVCGWEGDGVERRRSWQNCTNSQSDLVSRRNTLHSTQRHLPYWIINSRTNTCTQLLHFIALPSKTSTVTTVPLIASQTRLACWLISGSLHGKMNKLNEVDDRGNDNFHRIFLNSAVLSN